MKTVSGKIVSSAPITLPKAAKIISKFAETENGASQAVRAYLRRTAASFNELRKLHRELEVSSNGKHKGLKSETSAEVAEALSQEPVQLYEDGERKKHKKKRKKEKSEDANFGDNQGNLVVENGEKRIHSDQAKELSEGKKHRKEKKSGDKIDAIKSNGSQFQGVEDGEKNRSKEGKTKRKGMEIDGEKGTGSSYKPTHDFTEEQSEEKKHNKEKKIGDQVHGVEDGGKIEIEEGKKKRKGIEIDGKKDNDSSEMQHTKKKKRRKIEAEG